MVNNKIAVAVLCSVALAFGACSRQQSDWQKTREANTADAYEQFLKKYPNGEFTAQAQARAKELYEERDWQKARDADTVEAYQAFLKQYPEGKWTEEARIRVENFTLAQAPGSPLAPASSGSDAAVHAPVVAPTASAPPAAPPQSAVPTGLTPLPPKPAVPPTVVKSVKSPAAVPPSAALSGAKPASGKVVTSNGTGPASTPATAQSTSPARHAAVHHDTSGHYAVQLGAFKSGADAAHRRWTYLQGKYPQVLAGLTSKVLTHGGSAGDLYRLQATELSATQAHQVCAELKAKSQPCFVVEPAR